MTIDLAWWQIALLYITAGGLFTWQLWFWAPDFANGTHDEQPMEPSLVWLFWPVLIFILALWGLSLAPRGMKRLAEVSRRKIDDEVAEAPTSAPFPSESPQP